LRRQDLEPPVPHLPRPPSPSPQEQELVFYALDNLVPKYANDFTILPLGADATAALLLNASALACPTSLPRPLPPEQEIAFYAIDNLIPKYANDPTVLPLGADATAALLLNASALFASKGMDWRSYYHQVCQWGRLWQRSGNSHRC
jgi:hypothetical protein